MYEYVEIGAAPSDENPAQVGTPDYGVRAKAECKRFVAQLTVMFGPLRTELRLDGAAEFIVKANPHDFGVYYEVAVRFSEDNENAASFAYFIENNTPYEWKDNRVYTLKDYRVWKGDELSDTVISLANMIINEYQDKWPEDDWFPVDIKHELNLYIVDDSMEQGAVIYPKDRRGSVITTGYYFIRDSQGNWTRWDL